MRFRQLDYVRSIVIHKTIREAARNLYVTEPTISQQIKTLEKQLEITLFEKHGRGIQLTPKGESIYPYIVNVLDSVDRLQQHLHVINNPDSGAIVFGLGPITSTERLQRLLEVFNQDFPNIKVNIYESGSMDLYDLLERGEIDIAVLNTSEETRDEMTKKNIRHKNLYNSNFTLMTSTEHPLASKEKISYKDLLNVPLMVYRNGLIQQSLLKLLGTEKNVVYSFVDYISIINLVKKGLGVSIVPESHINQLSSQQKTGLRFVEFSDFGSEMKVSCIYRRENNYPEYINGFINHLLSTFKVLS